MARKKNGNGEASGLGHNSTLTDEEKRALTLHHKRKYEAADALVEKAKADRTAIADQAKHDLGKGALADIKDMIIADSDKMKALLSARCAWRGGPAFPSAVRRTCSSASPILSRTARPRACQAIRASRRRAWPMITPNSGSTAGTRARPSSLPRSKRSGPSIRRRRIRRKSISASAPISSGRDCLMVDEAAKPSMTDPPFAVAPNIVLDLPPPLSVNRTRKVDWIGRRKFTAWQNVADGYVLAAKSRSVSPLKIAKIEGFELLITISEQHSRVDLDNGLKSLIDYLRRIELIEDDGPKHMRRLTVEWGRAPYGCRVTIKPLPATDARQ